MIEEDYTNKRIVAVSLKISLHKDIMYLISCTRCTLELIDEYTVLIPQIDNLETALVE